MGVRVSLWAQDMKFPLLIAIILSVGIVLLSYNRARTEKLNSDKLLFYKEACDQATVEEKEECFVKLMKKISLVEPLETIFRIYANYATSDDVECHSLGHIVGKIAQEKTNTDIPSVLATTDPDTLHYCGWGFWHGYMGSLTEKHSNTPNTLHEFCAQMGKRYNAESDCFHGVGLGAIGDPPPQEFWGKPDALLQRAFALCDAAADENFKEVCYQGGFHQMIDYMVRDNFEFTHPDPNDPFDMCLRQEGKLQHACFVQMAPGVYARSGGQILRNEALINTLRRLPFFPEIVSQMIAGAVNASGTDVKLDQFLSECSAYSQATQACIDGILIGELGKGDERQKKGTLNDWCTTLDFGDAQYCLQKLSVL